MAKTKQSSILASIPGIDALDQFVRLLNTTNYKITGTRTVDYQPIQTQMRRLVESWAKSGPNVSKLLDANPMVAKATRDTSPIFIPTSGSTGRLAYLSVPEYSLKAEPRDIAVGHFVQFLINPDNERLGGPCRTCGNYYLRKSERKKSVYCSERCGHRLTSKLTNKERRDRDHQTQLRRANESIAEWLKTKTAKPWKEWVSKRTLITKHWLTRAVRSGEITEPVKPS